GGRHSPAGSSPGQVAGQRLPPKSPTSVARIISPSFISSCNAPAKPADRTRRGSYGTLPRTGLLNSQFMAASVRAEPRPVSKTSTVSQAGPQNRAQQGAPGKRCCGRNSLRKGCDSRLKGKRMQGSLKE